jgi:trimeric autotransporter adhesin
MKYFIAFIIGILCPLMLSAQWLTTGNAGTNPATNFIGTTNNVPLIFKTNNTFSGTISGGLTSFGLNSCQAGHGSNTAFGENALKVNAYPGGWNSAFGYSALAKNTSGGYNTAVGQSTLLNNILGQQNTAVGHEALMANLGDFNTAIGMRALVNSTGGVSNTAVGSNALANNLSGSDNVGIGRGTGGAGNGNTSVGTGAGAVVSGNFNTLIGYKTGFINAGANDVNALKTGSNNCFIGFGAGQGISSGIGNTIIGFNGQLPSSLNNTVILGSQEVGTYSKVGMIIKDGLAGLGEKFRLTSATSLVTPNNTLEISQGTSGKSGLRLTNLTNATAPNINPSANKGVLSVDANGDVILVTDQGGGVSNACTVLNFIPKTAASTGNLSCSQVFDGPVATVNASVTGMGVGINTTTPGNRLEIKHGTDNNSGLRFTNLNSDSKPQENKTKTVLSLNEFGDVILVKDIIGTSLTNSCTTPYNVPTAIGTTGNLTCGQMFDNGTTVSIGTPLTNTTAVTYTLAAMPPLSGGTVPLSGVVKLDVNGIIRTTGIFATSDRKFKKKIATIKNALTIVQNLDGRTYNWNKEANKEINFDDNTHSGFIAQEIEKVLPHLVATSENGDKSVNYQEVIPYLVEAIKEQQSAISDLKKAQDLLLNRLNQLEQDSKTCCETKQASTYIPSVSDVKKDFKLQQNVPNPFIGHTRIDYYIPQNSGKTLLSIFDLTGKQLQSHTLKGIGEGSILIDTKGLSQGMYVYALVVNGQEIISKKMIVEAP